MLDGFGLPAADGSVIEAGTPPVLLNVAYKSLGKVFPSISMSLGMNIAGIKAQLFSHYDGTPPESAKLILLHLDGSPFAELDDDEKLLDAYGPLNGWTILVDDTTEEAAEPDASWATKVDDWSNYPPKDGAPA